jgi:flagellar hook-associated protein 3 FlgL
MFSILTAANTFLANLSNLEQRIINANRQVSSGKRVQTVTDDPSSVTAILELNNQITTNNQLGQNLSKVQTEVNAAESSINSATTLMDRAVQLAAQGATATTTPATRQQLANQVLDLLHEMQGLANTQVEGRYVFSGDSDQTPPYGTVDLTTNTTNGVGAYQGSASTRQIQGPNGSILAIALTAQQIFDGGPSGTPSTSALQSLTELYNALITDDASASAQAASDISSASVYLNGQQALYGDIQNRVQTSLDYQSVLKTNLEAQRSAVQDADQAKAITTLQTYNTAQQAAMAAYSALPKKSLFDFLA